MVHAEDGAVRFKGNAGGEFMKRAWLWLLFLPGLGAAGDHIDAFGLRWRVPTAADWKVENTADGPVLQLLVPRPSLAPRRPSQFALAETPDFIKVTLEAEVKKEPAALRNRHTSVMIAYAWRDPDHFNYAHISVDSSEEQPVHNGIFHVFGSDRVRISPRQGPGTLLEEKWYPVRLVYDGRSGECTVWVDGKTSPSLHAVDKTLGAGKVGLGSFFDMGSFRNVKIRGE
jgi:hypothetical protein